MHGEVKLINGKRVATPEYRSWQMMKNRCLNPKAADYAYYGGRGILICSDWLAFDGFLKDMGRKPEDNYTLERLDTSGNYWKNNCIWATRQQQARNRDYVKLSIEVANEIRSLYATGQWYQYELAEKFEITQAHVSQIIRNVTWRNEDGGALCKS